jgi:2-amino-4-hydroxy-6-hydroxymethyldihydropteridine diphosphokinase
MYRVALSIGSNLGNRESYLQFACQSIHERIGEILRVSTIYSTPPWGFESESLFLNQALTIETRLSPIEVLKIIREIETEAGRIRQLSGYQSRTLDIDIVFFEDWILDLPELKIPHPLMQDRLFVLNPLAEIAGDWQHPVYLKSVSALQKECVDQS